jgi:replication initiation and membrane attachment protein DnaB
MKPTERSLYVCLLHESERCSNRKLQRTDGRLLELVGGSSRSFRDARIKLQERGLIRYVRGRGNVYVYTLCDPETLEPWPGDSKVQIHYAKKSGNSPAPNAQSESVLSPSSTAAHEAEDFDVNSETITHGVAVPFD